MERRMMIWKNGKTTAQVAEDLLRKHLIRCHRVISKDYPEIAGMAPANAADFLLNLRNTGRIRIELFNETPTLIGCRIVELNPRRHDASNNGVAPIRRCAAGRLRAHAGRSI